ncbi:MAG TPA: 3-dehydroquinate synthase [Kofleriaceae bacterium]|nr:3-dehydroquinate synthase [Kofleriaceae bacterium]
MTRPLFLIGFMAAGKSTVGRAAAISLGRRFVDLDDEIAKDLDEPPAALVARDEPAFRRAEAAALARVIQDSTKYDLVIATGGGAAAHPGNLERMREAGVVIALTVSLDEARRRAASGGPRPNLARADVDELYARRELVYRRAHAGVATDGIARDEVVARVIAVARAADRLGDRALGAAYLALGDRTYAVTVGDDPLDGALVARAFGERRPTKLAIITDDNVGRHHGAAAKRALEHAGLDVAHTATIAAGEASKSLAEYARLHDELVGAGLDRGSAIVGLGGGVVGDLAGFVASTFMRGIPVVHWPTTLVAMTDSAIGGKTGVDLAAGKNLVGTFWQPRLVACHLPVLATLPARERRAAFGELWKYALLDGEDTWAATEALATWAAQPTEGPAPRELEGVIRRAATYKAWIVGRDERELRGERALLNLGHTVGHAIESAAGGRLVHGEAIALGLVASCRVSHALGLTDDTLEPRVTAALRATGLDADLDPHLTPEVLARVGVDKKRAGKTLRFVAIRTLGACELVDMSVADLPSFLRPTSAL